MGRIYRRKEGGAYWGDWQAPDGSRRRASLRTKDPRVARERLRKAELAETDAAPDREPQSLAAALDYMIEMACADKAEGTRRMYRQKAGHLLRILGDVDITEIARGDAIAYTHQRQAEGAHTHTIHKEMVTLRKALRVAHEIRPLPVPPVDIVPSFKARYIPRHRHLAPMDLERLMPCVPQRRRLWVMVAVYTGACLGELERMDWRDVNFKARTIRIRGTKTDARPRDAQIPDPLLPWLLSARRPSGLVLGRWGNVCRDLAIYCGRAKIDPVTPNDLRRTFASWLKQAGVDSRAVADLMGHSSTRMVDMVYGRLTPDTYRAAVSALPSCAVGVPDGGRTLALAGEIDRSGESLNRAISEESRVPRDGIEPPTRGFSVRKPADATARILELRQKRRGGA
jgi:integrase